MIKNKYHQKKKSGRFNQFSILKNTVKIRVLQSFGGSFDRRNEKS